MTIPNNSFREDGVQDRFVDLLLHNDYYCIMKTIS